MSLHTAGMRDGPNGMTLLEAVEAESALTPRMLTPRQLKTAAVRKKEVLGGEGVDNNIIIQRERQVLGGEGEDIQMYKLFIVQGMIYSDVLYFEHSISCFSLPYVLNRASLLILSDSDEVYIKV
jgi:hypothetical protein